MCLTVPFHKCSLEPSTSYSIHFFTQSLSSLNNKCLYHHNLFCCSTEIVSSTPGSLPPGLWLTSLGNITQFIIQQHNCTHNKNTWWKRRATSDTTFCRTIQLEWEIWRKVFLTFSSIIFTSASFLCFFVWYGFASSASKFGSPAPRKCNTDKLTTKNVRHSCLQCCCLQ